MSAHIAGKQISLRLEDYLIQQAVSRLGGSMVDPRNAAWFFDDFLATGNTTNLAVNWNSTYTLGAAPAAQSISDEGGGVQQITVAAAAGSRASNFLNGPAVANANTKPWYCVFRKKLTTAFVAASKSYAGIFEANGGGNAITAGFHGTLHATNFVAQYDGAESGNIINLGVAADTAYHVFEIWGIGDGKLHAAIDFGPDLGGVALNAGLMITAANGRRESVDSAGVAVRTVRYDYYGLMCKRS
jgi:hypothetical protein